MSAKYDKPANSVNHTPSGAVAVGDVVAVGGLIGVAREAIGAGKLGTLTIKGQFEIDLASSQTFTAGDAVYVDATSKAHASTGSFFGWAVADSDATAGTVKAVLVQSVSDDVS
jgi:predicted RecA/RadA family phage recombinase